MTRPTVRPLLGRGVPTLAPTVTLAAAVVEFEAGGWEAAAVMRHGRLLGLVLAQDLAAARPSAATTLAIGEVSAVLERVPVERIMRRDTPTIAPDTPIAEAARLLRDGAPPLAVLDGARLVGLVGVGDLLAALDRPDRTEDRVELHDLVINR